MLSYAESSLLVVLAMLVSVAIVLVLNWVWPIPNRKLINDVTGWQLGILGTTYGVILGFMLYTVRTDFREAQINSTLEATSLLIATRVAAGLPGPERKAVRTLGIRYVDAVIYQDWPAMQHQKDSEASRRVASEMWRLLASVKIDSDSANSVDHLTRVLSDLTERRNLREEELKVRLPLVLVDTSSSWRRGDGWFVLPARQ